MTENAPERDENARAEDGARIDTDVHVAASAPAVEDPARRADDDTADDTPAQDDTDAETDERNEDDR